MYVAAVLMKIVFPKHQQACVYKPLARRNVSKLSSSWHSVTYVNYFKYHLYNDANSVIKIRMLRMIKIKLTIIQIYYKFLIFSG